MAAAEVRRLIAVMATTNVGYMPNPAPPAGARQRWSTFIDNHLREILAVDFAVIPTLGLYLLDVFCVLNLERRRILHVNVTRHPTEEWTARQVVEACAFAPPGRFPVRDSDGIYGATFRHRMRGLGLEQVRTAFRSPWQNGYAERWIGSLRRECLDHVSAVSERQLLRVVREYVAYHHADRTHLGLGKETPDGREAEPPDLGKIVAFPRVSGLYHRYTRRVAQVR